MRHVANALRLGPAGLLGAALLVGCFNPPAERVQFACDPGGAAECPDGYECRRDGCCHREDTPDDDAYGACKLNLGGGGAGGLTSSPPPPPGTTTDAEDTDSATDATGDAGADALVGATSSGAEGAGLTGPA
jgi:hypothetical protein